jgi:ribosomal protein S18 acetylase RimI-like enzyme
MNGKLDKNEEKRMILTRFQEEHTYLIETYTLPEEQLCFTGYPAESVALCRGDSNCHAILGIEDAMLVTYFALHEKEGVRRFSDNPAAILLRTFSTDYYHLGKGYGKEALRQLPAFVQRVFPHIDEIVLVVNEGNTIARRLYEKTGYRDTGRRMMGRKGMLVIMSSPVSVHV